MLAGERAAGVVATGFALYIVPAIDLMAAGTGEMFHHLGIPGFPSGLFDSFQGFINFDPVGHLCFKFIQFFTREFGAITTEFKASSGSETDHMAVAAVGCFGGGTATVAAYRILGDIHALRDKVQGCLIILLCVLVYCTGIAKYTTYA